MNLRSVESTWNGEDGVSYVDGLYGSKRIGLGEIAIAYGHLGVLSRVWRRQAYFRVDIKQAFDAAWRPDSALDTEDVSHDVVVFIWPADGLGARDL